MFLLPMIKQIALLKAGQQVFGGKLLFKVMEFCCRFTVQVNAALEAGQKVVLPMVQEIAARPSKLRAGGWA